MLLGKSILACIALALLAQRVHASVNVTGASGGTAIPATNAASGGSGAWTTLGAIQIAEGKKSDIQSGSGVTLVLKIPAGFELNTNLTPSISFAGGGDISSASVAVNDHQTLTITLTVSGTAAIDTLTMGATGLQVRALQTAPLASGKHIYRPSSGGGTASINGLVTSADGSSGTDFGDLTEAPGPFIRLLLLLPGETAAPGTPNGKTGSPSAEIAGTSFNATVNAADQYWNIANSASDVVSISCSDTNAILPSNAALSAGTAILPVTFRTAGSWILTAADVTDGSKPSSTSPPIAVSPGAASVLVFAVAPSAQATAGVPFAQQPAVFVEDAYNNIRSNDTLTVSAAVGSGGGTLLGGTSVAAAHGLATFTNLAATAATNITLRFTSGSLAPAISGAIAVAAGPFSRLLVLLPGETALPGSASGRSGSPLPQETGLPFTVNIRSVDAYWNGLSTNDVVHLTSSDPLGLLPPDGPLFAGSASTTVILRTAGSNLTISASDVTHPGITAGTSSLLVVTNPPFRNGAVVAIHDSEQTRALETLAASPPTPTGPGTTGQQWWPTNWHYFVMPEMLKELLRSDGTVFDVVSDADITAGRLMNTNGRPKYPILISLASEAIGDGEVAQLTNYVAAGGFLLTGSSAFTRRPDGTSYGDFALANAMGIHMVSPSLTNWLLNRTFTKVLEHRMVSHIPSGQVLSWEMPAAADEIPWGIYPHPGNPSPASSSWQVQAAGATVIAQGDLYPCLLDKPFGAGHFIYYAPMQPLLGDGGYSPGMYAYGIFRNAIQWAFDSAKLPVSRLSPWPYPYDAALMVRHDLEDYQAEIASILPFAQFEKSLGAKGDYYFCTGTLRVEMPGTYDTNAVIAGMRLAISNYNATIGPHNGGLRNPYNNPPLTTNNYDYWHWGPDEALDTVPTNYPDGRTYALTSVSNAFQDVERWLPGQITNGMRTWAAPYFDATREPSLGIQAQLNVKTTGDQKLGPFPHWTLSTATSGKRYPFVSLPVSDWFVDGTVAQSMETGHTIATARALVDYYYGLGALINLYGHHLTTNDVHGDYVAYSLNTNLHPRLWPANAISLYNWWLSRSNIQMAVTSVVTNTNQSVTTLSISGSSQSNLTVELLLPSGTISGLQVLTNGILAGGDAYRLNGQVLKTRVGTTVTTAQVIYRVGAVAVNDSYIFPSGPVLTVAAPGVLANDSPGLGGTNLAAALVAGPTNGSVILGADGSFTYIPKPVFAGVDTFTYRVNDGISTSGVAVVTLTNANPAAFAENFTRTNDPGSLSPWLPQAGAWTITGGELLSGTNPPQTYANLYLTNNWTDYAVQARFQFPVGAYGAGLGGRVNPMSGAHYAAWIYPENSAGGSNVLRLLKFQSWNSWILLQQANLAAVGTNWHTVKLGFYQNRVAGWFDGVELIAATDTNLPPLASGGVSIDMWTDATGYQFAVDNVSVTRLIADDSYVVPENSTLSITAPGVLGNDSDVLAAPLPGPPATGAGLSASLVASPARGLLAFNADGSFVYTPAANYSGPDSFIYQANDGPTILGTAWVNLSVQSVAPVFQSVVVSKGTAVLSWSALSGRTYRLQYKAHLPDTSWTDLPPDTTASGPTATATNALGGAAQRFYRVVLLP